MIVRSILIAASILACLTAAEACQFIIKKGTTLLDWPDDIVAARVKVLAVRTSLDREKQWTQLEVLEPLRGALPAKVGVLSKPDAASCGYGFAKGDIFIVGLVRREDASPNDRYPYTADTRTESWVSFAYGHQH